MQVIVCNATQCNTKKETVYDDVEWICCYKMPKLEGTTIHQAAVTHLQAQTINAGKKTEAEKILERINSLRDDVKKNTNSYKGVNFQNVPPLKLEFLGHLTK